MQDCCPSCRIEFRYVYQDAHIHYLCCYANFNTNIAASQPATLAG